MVNEHGITSFRFACGSDDYLRPRLIALKSQDLKMRITLLPINTDFVDHGEYFAGQYGDVALKSSSACSQFHEPGAYEPW